MPLAKDRHRLMQTNDAGLGASKLLVPARPCPSFGFFELGPAPYRAMGAASGFPVARWTSGKATLDSAALVAERRPDILGPRG